MLAVLISEPSYGNVWVQRITALLSVPNSLHSRARANLQSLGSIELFRIEIGAEFRLVAAEVVWPTLLLFGFRLWFHLFRYQKDDNMVEKPQSSGREEYIVAAVAMTCLSNLLMSKWVENHTEADLDELVQAIGVKIKNANIEGLSYSQQEALVRRSVIHAGRYLDAFRKQLRDRS